MARTERVIAFVRLGVVLFNCATFLIFTGDRTRWGAAVVVMVLAVGYALLTVLWRDPGALVLRPSALTLLDNAFIAVWIWATGGFESPYFVLFFAEAAASVTRFDLVRGILSMAGSAAIYLAVVVFDGGGPAYEVTVRVGYIFVIGVLAAHMIELVRTSERDAASAEAARESYQVLSRLKSNFVANVSHELRTPLTAIRGAASTLTRHDDRLDPASRKELAEMISRQSTGLTELIEDLIDIGLVDRGSLISQMMTIDVAPLIHQEIEQARELTSRVVKADVPEFGVRLRCDPAKVMKALRKLLENAVKFSDEATVVRVSVAQTEELVKMTVEDQGVGIDEEHLGQIFDRFYQVDPSATRSASGTGVGLTITNEIVSLHGGSIDVRSKEGEGTSITLVFPREATPARESLSL